MMQHRERSIWATVARPMFLMLIAPFGPLAAYTIFGGSITGFAATPWQGLILMPLVFGVGIGIHAILKAPWPDNARAIIAGIYVPLLCAAMLLATFVANCELHADCL